MKTVQILKNKTMKEALPAVRIVKDFIPAGELNAIIDGMRSEEKQFFIDKMISLSELINGMPKTYEQDRKGMQAIAYLHYFKGDCDWYITEKDMGTPDEEDQIQAFGWADIGYGGELGYISIAELVENGVELDLYFTPKTLAEIKEAQWQRYRQTVKMHLRTAKTTRSL